MARYLDEVLADVRQYATPESTYPLAIGTHYIRPIKNEVYERDDDGRIQVDIRLWCEDCGDEHRVVTTLANNSLKQLRLLKLSILARFYAEDCSLNS